VSRLTVATWNVNGVRAREEQLLEWLSDASPDVLCLQEIKASPDVLSDRLRELDGYWNLWHGEGGYSGVSLHVRRDRCDACPTFTHPPFDMETRIAAATVEGIEVASIYVPNGGKDFAAKLEFLEAMRAYASELREAGRQALLCGDLNVALTDADLHPKEQRKKDQVGTRPDERALLDAVIGEGLVDVGRALDPDNDRLYTWWAPWRNLRQRNIGWRIDYVLASRGLFEGAVSCEVQADVGTSDHAPVVATFEL
jgi:exodeoxyribonuclease-3